MADEASLFRGCPRFSGAKRTETGWADGVFLLHAGRKDLFDTLKREPFGSRFFDNSVTYRLLDFLQMCIASADLISSSRKLGCAMPIRASERSQVDMPFRFTMPYSVTI